MAVKSISRGVACPKCGHRPTLLQAIRISNPIQFPCPNCRVKLTLGPVGWVLLLPVAGLAIVLALFAAGRFNSGAWSLLECGLFFVFILVVVFRTLEWLFLRFASVSLRREPAA
jgi:hypothetical protein